MTTPPRSFEGPFVFINRDATNIKLRSADEAYAIGSHVSGRYTRWSKTSRLRDPNTGKAKLLTHSSTGDSPEDETAEDNDRAFSSQSSSPEARPQLRRSSTSQKKVVLLKASVEHRSRSQGRQFPPSLITILQNGNSDPFSASSVPITPLDNHLITTWQTILVQTVYPSEVLNKVPLISPESADMLGSPERMHFLLAWSLGLQLSAMPVSETKKRLEIKALMHKTAGLKTLQKNLPTMAKLTAIRAVWHLLGAEFYGGNSVAALTHFRAMITMVQSIGGLQSLPWELRKLIVVSDMTLSSMMGTKSAFNVVCLLSTLIHLFIQQLC
jgi:hypothetical protein